MTHVEKVSFIRIHNYCCQANRESFACPHPLCDKIFLHMLSLNRHHKLKHTAELPVTEQHFEDFP